MLTAVMVSHSLPAVVWIEHDQVRSGSRTGLPDDDCVNGGSLQNLYNSLIPAEVAIYHGALPETLLQLAPVSVAAIWTQTRRLYMGV